MGKDPAFLFYPGDYIGGTMGMSFEEKGAYMDLLMMQFNRGHMTEDMIRRTIGHLWDVIKDKFIEDDEGKFYNKRLEEEKLKRQRYTESRRNNKAGINQHSKKNKSADSCTTARMTNHMENVNQDLNNTIELVDQDFESEIQISLCEYFGITKLGNERQWMNSIKFVMGLKKADKLDFFKEQFAAYKEYRIRTKATWNHKFPNFICDGWNEQNWIKNLENIVKNENTQGRDSKHGQPSRQEQAINSLVTRLEEEDRKCS